jgi:glucose-6-phosphate 1-epimerase
VAPGKDAVQLKLRLCASAATRQVWPQDFEAEMTFELQPGCLTMTLGVRNTDRLALNFTGALHTYLAVEDIATVHLEGLQGQAEWDALTDRRAQVPGPLRFDGEFDRVYDATDRPLLLCTGDRRLHITQSPSFANTVIWNPGSVKGDGLADLPVGGYAHMLCVEAAQVEQQVIVPAGGEWQGWQRLSVP